MMVGFFLIILIIGCNIIILLIHGRESIELEKFMDREKRRGEEEKKKKIIILVVSFNLFIILDLSFFHFISFGLYINKSERRYETTRRRNHYLIFIFLLLFC